MADYSAEVEAMMLNFYNTLDEAGRRRYAGLEAERIGHGGLAYVESLFGITHKTVVKGVEELSGVLEMAPGRVRKPGSGQKPKADDPLVKAAFDAVLLEHTAGSPMEEGQFWTYLNPKEIAEQMELKGIKVSRTVVKKLLKAGGFVRRKSQKNKAMGESKDRNGQFENIKKVVKRHKKRGDAVISMDTKKRNR
jgi:hypothetical protein